MLNQTAMEGVLQTEGFLRVHSTKKLSEYRRGSESVYLKHSGTSHPLVVHGRHAQNVTSLAAAPGVERTKSSTKPYHNSNMRSFDLRQNTGKKSIRYGFDFGFGHIGAMRNFLQSL